MAFGDLRCQKARAVLNTVLHMLPQQTFQLSDRPIQIHRIFHNRVFFCISCRLRRLTHIPRFMYLLFFSCDKDLIIRHLIRYTNFRFMMKQKTITTDQRKAPVIPRLTSPHKRTTGFPFGKTLIRLYAPADRGIRMGRFLADRRPSRPSRHTEPYDPKMLSIHDTAPDSALPGILSWMPFYTLQPV